MAATSAGTLQPGVVPVSVPVPGALQQLQQQQHHHQQQQQQQSQVTQKVSYISRNNNNNNNNNSDSGKVNRSVSQPPPKSNLAPGWRRVNYNSEIIYISPSGTALRNFTQVKDYLLSPGTCKCGLPCPFRPEIFFEFDSQVPNSSLPIPLESDIPRTFCLHQKRHLDKQELIRRGDVKTRKPSIGEWSPNTVTSNPNNERVIMSSQNSNLRYQTAQSVNNYGRNQGPNQINVYQNNPNTIVKVENEITTIPLSRTPPWRKNVASNQTKSQQIINQNEQNQIVTNYTVNNERVPPLPQQHVAQNQQQVWQDESQRVPVKVRNVAKKRPTFKEDPTGYLNQQTAILHSSISTLHSPDGSSSSQDPPPLKTHDSNQFNNQTPISNQNNINSSNNQNVDVPLNRGGQESQMDNRIYNASQHHGYGNQEMVQIQPEAVNTEIVNLPNSTTIGGQTVTHMPNGMVQVHQNCDISQLKPQQQIQFQQQLQRQNQLIRQNHELQMIHQAYEDEDVKPIRRFVPASQESPVSSSTTFNASRTPDITSSSSTPDLKGPVQAGAISTSNRSPSLPSSHPSPAESPESYVPRSSTQSFCLPKLQTGTYASAHTTLKNTVTSVLAGKSLTSTSTTTSSTNHGHFKQTIIQRDTDHDHGIENPNIIIRSSSHNNKNENKPLVQNTVPVSTSLSSINFQQMCRDQQGQQQQLLMTSTGQIIMMPAQTHKSSNQMIINQSGTQNVMIPHNQNNNGNTTQYVNVGSNSGNNGNNGQSNINIIQNIQQQQNINSNFIMNSPNNMQSTVILNNGNVIQQNNSQVLHHSNNLSKVMSNNGNILTNQSNLNQLIAANNSNMMQAGQQTVVLNTLPNGIMIQQPNYNTVEGQVVNQIINQDGTTSYIQQTQQRQIVISPDSKRKTKKRKSSSGSITPNTLSPQSLQMSSSPIQQQTIHNVNQQSGTMLQITPQYSSQGYQLSPGISGLTLVPNKNHQQGQQQQILLQNGQTIIQPLNIIGQQLLVPAGLVVTPDTTLVQIQNMGSCGSILTPQGMMIRAQSPQQKNFLSPNGGQQFIVNNSGQISPMGQIYGTSLIMPQHQSSQGTSYVQQNATIIQQQSTHMMSQQNQSTLNTSTESSSSSDCANAGHSVSTQTAKSQNSGSASPPDTTTHSPNSPDRPPSEKSGGSNDSMNMAMVQCVSSSEPDAVVSPGVDSAQSPSNSIEYFERGGITSYQHNVYKPSDAKIRRIQTPTHYRTNNNNNANNNVVTQGNQSSNLVRPDSHESPTNSASNSASPTPTTYCIGELVWGAVRGHPAWPGKVVIPPEGVTTPIDCAWVRWFGGRPNAEMVSVHGLKSLSEGLEAHHKAQKDARKSRKLNSQLERAIQEAMAELDRTSANSPIKNIVNNNNSNAVNNNNLSSPTSMKTGKTRGTLRSKLVKIAPAPPIQININNNNNCTNNSNNNDNRTKAK